MVGEPTARQRRFVEEYLIDCNATQAALRAGFSARSAQSQGSRLLRRPSVRAAVEKAMAARAERMKVSADRVLEELACIAFSDIREVAIWGPEGLVPRASKNLSEGAVRAGAEVAETGSGTSRRLRVKLHDKRAALEALARHLGLYLDATTANKFNADTLPPLQILLHQIDQADNRPDVATTERHQSRDIRGDGS